MKQIQKLLALFLLTMLGTSAWAISQKADGTYVIKNAADLYSFAKLVNAGEYDAKAVVTADIDYTSYGTDPNALIGGNTWATAFAGSFDAQQHTITIATNLDRSANDSQGGLFSDMANGAVVKNLWLTGTLTGNGRRMSGLCHNINGVTMQNVLVTVDINSTWAGQDSDLASGGIFGQGEGTNSLKNVVYSGSFKCTGGGKDGGKNEWFAGIAGWVENGLTTMENCAAIIESFSVDELSAVGSDANGYNIKTSPMSRHDENLVEATNCYSCIPADWQYKTNYKNYFTENGDKTCDVAITHDQVMSGYMCYMLNQGGNANFTQDIDIDNFAVPFAAHDKVYLVDGSYTNYNGCYYINTAQKLNLFAHRVNAGQYDLNAFITADIDYTAYATDANGIIGGGEWAKAYMGTFDAQGHKITIATNLDRASRDAMGGLFGDMANGAVVKNLWLDGTLTGNGRRMSSLCHNVNGVTIQNVLATVDINSTWAGQDSDLASGGILGQAEGTNTLKNVIWSGSFKCTGGGKDGGKNEWFGGIAGWVENGLTTMTNCAAIFESFSVDELSAVGSDANSYNIKTSPLSRHDENLVEAYNCYSCIPADWQYKTNYKNYFTENGDKTCDKSVTIAQVKSGELCYLLNSGSDEPIFGQNINIDKCPVPNTEGHSIVYKDGSKYTNDNEEGIYEISTAEQMDMFAKRVNAGEYSLNARLTADIDYTENGVDMIGGTSQSQAYLGTFDGNGHKITINKTTTSGMPGGLFTILGQGSVVENLWLDGTLNSSGRRPAGLARESYGTFIKNVLVTVDLNSTYTGSDGDLAAGGVVGYMEANNSMNHVIYKGTITNSAAKDPNFGGLEGWVESGILTVKNCLTIVDIDIPEDNLRNAQNPCPFARVRGHNERIEVENSYYVNLLPDWIAVSDDCSGNNSTGYISPNCKPLTMDQVTSGEACYKLNGDQTEIGFWQLIGEDELPIPYEQENGQVYLKDGVYTNSDADLIRTADDLFAFAKAVNAGDYARNAKVMADIDYTEYGTDANAVIGGGEWAKAYTGTFDAQGHKITIATNLDRANRDAMGGLFADMANGATVKNLWLDGTITGNGRRMSGLCHNVNGVTIQNVVATVNIISTWAGQDSDLASGGILGQAEGTNTLKNVIWAGDFKCIGGGKDGGKNEWFGGIAGWVENGLTTMTNCAAIFESFSVDELSAVGSDANSYNIKTSPLSRHDENLVEAYNCYSCIPADWQYKTNYKNYFTENGDKTCDVAITMDQVKSGELCFRLNGKQTDLAFWQTINQDAVPVITSKGHKVVYGKGDIACDGTLKGNNTFSNDAPNEMDPHNFEDGVCTVCGSLSSDTKLTLDEDGYYNISDKYQMAKAYELVNNGEKDANFRLVADIDMSSDDYKKAYFTAFSGTFDGQYHTLTVNLEGASVSLFGALTGTVKNLIVKGKVVNLGERDAVISTTPGNCTVENVEVGCEMHSQYNGSNGYVFMGGFFGYVGQGIVANLTNCAFTGHMIQDQQPTDKEDGTPNYYDFRGIAGLAGRVDRGTLNLRGCLVACEAPSYYGSCYIPTGNWEGSTVTQESDGTFIGQISDATVTSQNVFSTMTVCDNVQGGTIIDPSVLTSGEACYKLNFGEWDEPVWRQVIGTDEYPLPNANKEAIVYQLRSGDYMGVHDNASMLVFTSKLVPEETEYLSNVTAAAVTKEQYQKAIDDIAAATTVAEFKVAYKAMRTAQTDIEAAVRNYEAYKSLAAQAKTYLEENELVGEDAEMLRSYLYDGDEPSEDFPNGCYDYIIEEMQLNNQGILDEKDFLNNLFRKAIGQGYQVGNEITMLMTNADFSNGWTGWGNGGTGSANISPLPIAENWRKTSDSYQTLTGLKEGVYEIDLNGLTRTAGNDYSRFYTAFLTANSIQVPIMNLQEDPISFSQAEDKVNCWVSNDAVLNEEAYYPASYQGASYAFGAERYTNRLVVNVGSDGTLKIGINQKGSGYDYDWMCVANTKLYYRGTVDEASETVALTLEGMVARANTILNAEFSVDMSTDVTPNFYTGLRTELQNAVDAAASASSASEQYEVVKTLSTLFSRIYTCQAAYVNLMDLITTYSDRYANAMYAGTISQDDYNTYMASVDNAASAYQEGSLTAAEANAIKFANPSALIGLITSASQLSSNASDRDEGQHIEYLIDGDISTFWHTDWHGVCQDEYHYLQVALNETFTGDITMKMTRRTQSGNDHPTKMIVWGSKDGSSYTQLTTLDLPFEGTGTVVTATFTVNGVNYLRFAASDCGGDAGYRTFWHAAEFQLYGENQNAIDDIDAETISTGIYNLAGQKLTKAQRGINIVDGKKILVK